METTEEKKNKTLSELLSSMSDDELIFIGAKTAWFFVGTVEEYRHYEKAVDRKLKDYWKEKIRLKKISFKRLLLSYLDNIEREIQTHKDTETDGFNLTTWYRTYFKDIGYRNNFKPTYEREVLDTYPHKEEGTAIVLEGEEVGEYYDSEEWELFNGEKKLKKYMETIKNDADT